MIELYYRLRYGKDSEEYRLRVGIMAAQLLERVGWVSCNVRGDGRYTLNDGTNIDEVSI